MSQTDSSTLSFQSIVTCIKQETTSINEIKLLINQNPDVIHQLSTNGDYTILDYAICYRDVAFIQDLINTYRPQLTFPLESKHNPYIFHAYEHEKYNVLDMLLEIGADPNEKDVDGIPLLNTIATDGNMTALNILLKYDKTNINITDDDSCNAAIHAARHNKFKVLDSLIRQGIDINHRDASGATPLMHAAFMRSYDCLDMLVKNDVKLNEKDNDGLTAINYAELGMKNEKTPNKACLDYLTEHGAQKYIEYDDVKQHTTIVEAHHLNYC